MFLILVVHYYYYYYYYYSLLVIICSNFGFNIFRGFRSTGGRNFRFPIDLLVIVTTVLTLPRSL